MKNTLLIAILIVVIIGATYVNLIITFGRPLADRTKAPGVEAWQGAAPVPDLAAIVNDRTKRDSGGDAETEFHTISEPPEVFVFQTKYKNGTQIVFNHYAHVEAIGLACIQCHHVESCSKCHLKGETHDMQVTNGKEAMHANCIGCHARDGGPQTCDACHVQ